MEMGKKKSNLKTQNVHDNMKQMIVVRWGVNDVKL